MRSIVGGMNRHKSGIMISAINLPNKCRVDISAILNCRHGMADTR